MKKLLLSLTFVAGLGFAASAQTEGAVRKLSIGADAGLLTEKGSKDLMMAGGSLQFEQPIAKSLNLTGSAGYMSLFSTAEGASGNIGFIPVKAGAKYYFGGNFYGAGELGASFSAEKNGNTGFLYAPTLGASFSIADKSSLDFGIRYENWSYEGGTTSFVGLRAAFAFGL